MCQQQNHAPQQWASLFDHLVGERQQSQGQREGPIHLGIVVVGI